MSAPSVTFLKTWAALTRWLLVAVLLFWLLFAAGWGTLHWVIVPRIGEFRAQLQDRAAQALGVPVRLGAVVARSNGLVPSFELTNVELFDPQGRVALRLSRVLVSLSPRSLWRLGFEQIYIDQPTLDIRRHPDGKISVAGLDFSGTSETNTPALNWLFSQLELVIANGVVRWTDEMQGTSPISLQGVDAVVRNTWRHHDMRLDATLPPQWGDRFSLRGRFVQPFLERQNGLWQQWDGQLFAAFERVDVAQLQRFAKLGLDLNQGVGALRAWVDVSQARVTAGTADVALSEVSVKPWPQLQELALQRVQGRFGLRLLNGGFEFSTQALTFDTRDGLHWPAGNVRYQSVLGADQVAHGELQTDHLDLTILAQIADRLPLQPKWREHLLSYAPKGRIDSLSANWQGPLEAPTRYWAQGQLRQIEVAAVANIPGVRALDVDFELNQNSGNARLSMAGGSVAVPAILQDGRIVLDQLSAQASWQRSGDDLSLDIPDVRFANQDAQGQASIKWHTNAQQRSVTRSRYPGVLDLQATLTRLDARQVHRYLPLVIDQAARDYVREAILDGSANNVKFVVKGDLDQLPQVDPQQGTFRITVPVSHLKLAFVPGYLQGAGEAPWPALNDISGELVIDRSQLQVKVTSAKLGNSGALQVTHAQASIADLSHVTVQVDAQFDGPLTEAFKTVQTSPLNALTARALAGAKATGVADYTLKLTLPMADLDKSTVQGSVRLVKNDLQIAATLPRLTRVSGLVSYTDKGLNLSGVQARLLGGDVRIEGGLLFASTEATRTAPTIRIAGQATAEGLRQTPELGFVARVARYLVGSTTYSAVLGLRFGMPDLLVTSTLQGMGSTLPAPLRKDAASSLPMRLQWGPPEVADRGQDRLSLSLDKLARVVYERDTTRPVARVLRGSISVGADTLDPQPLPTQGVSANLHLARLDVDHWSGVLSQLGLGASLTGTRAPSGAQYLPTTLALRTDGLVFGAREFNQLAMGIERTGTLWRATVNAAEVSGYLEYRQAADARAASAGRVYARLTRLTLIPNAASEVESLIDAQPASIPALDVVVDAFEFHGKRLGRLEMEAINRLAQDTGTASRVREWRLNKFNLIVPEATLTANGNWTRMGAPAGQTLTAASAAGAAGLRRTMMNFKLDVRDGGKLLERFDMPGVVRQANGKIEGQAAWVGSPLKPDYPSLGGAFTVNMTSGQFLKAEPGLAKLLGVLSLQALPRRLTLDFHDVFSQGFAFDFVRGDVTIDKGIARTNNLQMKGITAAVLMEGQANLAKETQDVKVVVVPEINAGTASLIATAINPAVGLGTFLTQWLLRRPLMDSATQEFHVDGSWADPRVTRISTVVPIPKETKP